MMMITDVANPYETAVSLGIRLILPTLSCSRRWLPVEEHLVSSASSVFSFAVPPSTLPNKALCQLNHCPQIMPRPMLELHSESLSCIREEVIVVGSCEAIEYVAVFILNAGLNSPMDDRASFVPLDTACSLWRLRPMLIGRALIVILKEFKFWVLDKT